MNSFFKASAFAAVALAIPTASFANDVDWTGAYVGAFTGYSQGTVELASETSRIVASGLFDHDANGVVTGLQAGADWQVAEHVVFGIAADVAFGDIGETKSVRFGAGGSPYVEGQPYNQVDMTTDINYVATIRARVGYSFGSNLAYVTGGLNLLNHTGSSYVNLAGSEAHGSDTQSHAGTAIGAGFERKLTDKMSVDALYLYSRSGDDRYVIDQTGAAENGGSIQRIDMHYDASIVRLSVNYRF